MLLAQKRASVQSSITYTLVNRTLAKSEELKRRLHPIPSIVLDSNQLHHMTSQELAKYDVLILGVKPTQLKDVLQTSLGLKDFSGEVISTLAGVTIATLKSSFSKARIYSRLMPSIVMGEMSSTALMLSTQSEHSLLTSWYKEPVGDLLTVNSEEELDQLTLFFGSNAAYLAALMQPWIEFLTNYFPLNDEAKNFTITQWISALTFLKDKNLQEVIAKVKTPGGITAQALLTLDQEKYSSIISKALLASSLRAKEVGDLVNRDLSSSNLLQQK